MINFDSLLSECTFKTSRSSGAGGQHVNKVETKITLIFDVKNSSSLKIDQKELLLKKLKTKLDKNGILQINSQKSRSQSKNKEDAILKFKELILSALKKPKIRRKTKISQESKLKRLEEKKIKSQIKKTRKKPKIEHERD